MREIDVGLIVRYLTDSITEEDKAFYKIVEWYFKTSTIYQNEIETEDMREHLLKLREIKQSYRKGLPFVRNLTKDTKKGLLSHWYDYIHDPEYAKEHLDFIKKHYSERTYFRHKKKLKDLGFI